MCDKPSVLIVDDEEVVRLSYARSLAGAECQTQEAWDGAEAIRSMERHPADVVLLDLRMPGADGLSILRQLKTRWPDCEVVIITGYPSVETAKEAVRLGAGDYLAKPLGPEKIIGAARGALTRKRWSLRAEPAVG